MMEWKIGWEQEKVFLGSLSGILNRITAIVNTIIMLR